MFLAYIRESDNTGQTVYEHSKNTALLTECFLQPVGLYFSNMLRKKRMGGKAEFEPGSKVMIMELNANPNGDPLNGDRPQENYDGYGEMSDVCIKRKIRNRLQNMGEKIFVQSDDRCDDERGSMKIRAEKNEALKKPDRADYEKNACKEWSDVRSFGQVFALKGDSKGSGLSIPIRGPVSVQMAQSVSPVDIITYKIGSSLVSCRLCRFAFGYRAGIAVLL